MIVLQSDDVAQQSTPPAGDGLDVARRRRFRRALPAYKYPALGSVSPSEPCVLKALPCHSMASLYSPCKSRAQPRTGDDGLHGPFRLGSDLAACKASARW